MHSRCPALSDTHGVCGQHVHVLFAHCFTYFLPAFEHRPHQLLTAGSCARQGWGQAPTPITQVKKLRPREMIRLRMQISELGHPQSTPSPILCLRDGNSEGQREERRGQDHLWRRWQSWVRDLRQVASRL